MKAVVSTVSSASVHVDGREIASVDGYKEGAESGALLALVGIGKDDCASAHQEDSVEYIAQKIANLRILPQSSTDAHIVWPSQRSVSALDNNAPVLVVSQFTLMGETRKGRRPSWSEAASSEDAYPLFQKLCDTLRSYGLDVQTGEFGAYMTVSSVNQGPYTLLIDSKDAVHS